MKGHRAAFAAALALAAPPCLADNWPSRPIHVVVPFAPGGALDVTARLFAQKMQESLGQPIIVDFKPGAAGNIGTEFVARAAPDGYTILITTNGLTISPALYRSLRYDPERDFAPVTQLFASSTVIVSSPRTPAADLAAFVALAKAKPGAMTYGSSGVGNALHMTMELFKLRAGIDMAMAPYRSDALIVTAVESREVQAAALPIQTAKPQIQAGELRGLAITRLSRADGLPDVKTFAEQGYDGFESGGFQGFFAPAGTPRDIVERLAREAKAALASPELREAVRNFGVDGVGSTPAEFTAFFKRDLESYKRVARDANIPMQD